MNVKHVANRYMEYAGKFVSGNAYAGEDGIPSMRADGTSGNSFGMRDVTADQWEKIKSEIDEAFRRWDDAKMTLTVKNDR